MNSEVGGVCYTVLAEFRYLNYNYNMIKAENLLQLGLEMIE